MSLRRFFRRKHWDEERWRELESYVEIETDANVARGLSPVEARRDALRKLGNPLLVREEIYRMNTMNWLESTWLDVKFGARTLRKSPVFAVVALLSLALGIGANAAIFQLLDIVRLRSLPVHDPQEMAEITLAPGRGRMGLTNGPRPNLTNPLWEQIRELQTSFVDPFAFGSAAFQLATGGESRTVPGMFVSGNYFKALEAVPAAGRLIAPVDDVRGCSPVAVLGHGFWQSEFGRAIDVTSRSIRLDGVMVPIVGVASARFAGIDIGRRIDIFVPICSRPWIKKATPGIDTRDMWWLAAFGRLKPGVTLEAATAELGGRSRGMFEATLPDRYAAKDAKNYTENTLVARSAANGISVLGTRYGSSLTFLLAIAGLVFLIACANLANLMLARASTRAREIAVRLAIGASRARLFRQLMAESLLLAAIGAAAGIALAGVLSRVLVSILTSDGSPWALDLSLDWRLIGFSTALAVASCVLFGVTPAVRATRVAPGAVMHLSGRGLTADRQRLGIRRFLVVGQMAVSLVLVVGALLFVGTLRNLASVDYGFSDRGVMVVDLDLRPAGVALEAQTAYQAGLTERLAAIPGVTSAGAAAITPVSGSGWNEILIVNGQEQTTYPDANRVSPGFFAALRIGFVAGRNFDAQDRTGGATVAIINEAFRDRYLGAGNPIGRQFKFRVGPGQSDPLYEVIGVVKNTKYRNLREPLGPQMYFPASQETDPSPFLTVIMRTEGDPNELRRSIASAVRDVHPSIVLAYTVMSDQLRDSLLRERLMAALSAGFAVLAVGLAGVGLYGLMAYGVAARRNEIGIRIALGATRSRVVTMILRETAWLVAIGLLAGGIGAVLAARYAQSLLYGLTGAGPAVVAAGALVLAAIAGLASASPAVRAANLDPTTALRDEM
jgi:putative ABC transport system permease protein